MTISDVAPVLVPIIAVIVVGYLILDKKRK